MKEQHAIAVLSNSLFTIENGIKWRESHGVSIDISERMMPEALRVVLDLAKSKYVTKVVDGIIKGES